MAGAWTAKSIRPFRLRTCTPGVFGSPSWASKTPPVVETVNKLPSGTGVPSLDKISALEIRVELLSSAGSWLGVAVSSSGRQLGPMQRPVSQRSMQLSRTSQLSPPGAHASRFCPLQRISPGTQTT